MGNDKAYPDGTTLISSAYTTAPNGGTISQFLHPILLGMLGVAYDVNSPLLRFAWPQTGAPFQDINDDICYVQCVVKDEPYDRIRYVTQAALPDPSVPSLGEHWNYTRCWNIRLIAYGPNAFDNLRAVRSGLYQDLFTQMLSAGNLFPVSDIPEVMRFPEVFNAQWWERADLHFDMYEWVSEAITRNAITSAEVKLYTEGVDAQGNVFNDLVADIIEPPLPPPKGLVLTQLGFDNFTPDQNPLDGQRWRTVPMRQPLQTLNGGVFQTEGPYISAAYWYGSGVLPPNQYVSITLRQLGTPGGPSYGPVAFLKLRGQLTFQGYSLQLQQTTKQINIIVDVDGAYLVHGPVINWNPGDVFTFAAIGTSFYVLQNNVQIASAIDNTYATGRAGLRIAGTPDNIFVTNFATGAVARSGS